MNEKIKKLFNICGMPNEDIMELFEDKNKTFYIENFAKLIIRTSILRMEHEDRDCGEWMGNVLMMHFNLTLAELGLPLQDEE